MNPWVIDVDETTFQQEVVQRSATIPVVVDFWAEWCGPCRTLGPLLERLAAESEGGFVVAKVDVDNNRRLAEAFAIQSIPAVKAIFQGRIVDEFVGAQPESAVREFLARLLPTGADREAERGRAAESAGDVAEAEAAYRRAIAEDPNHPAARLGLGRLYESSRPDDALDELERVLPGTPERVDADRIAARIRLHRTGGAGESELRARIGRDPADLGARLELGQHLAAAGAHEEALELLLEVVRRDRSFADDAARKAMVDVFELLGARHPLTERFRDALAQALFR